MPNHVLTLGRPLLFSALLLAGAAGFAQTRPEARTHDVPARVAQQLRQQQKSLQLADDDLSSLVLSSETVSKHNGMRHLYVQQRYRGVEIHNAISTVNTNRTDEVVHVANRFYNNLGRRAKVSKATLTADAAVAAAARHLGLSPKGPVAARSRSTEPDRSTVFGTGGISLEPITAKLVYQPLADGSLRLAWEVSIYELNALNWWEIRLDASTGEVLDKNNLVTHCEFDNHGPGGVALGDAHPLLAPFAQQAAVAPAPYAAPASNAYNVYALPAESPSHGPREYVSGTTADAVASPFGWHDTNGAAGPEFTTTRGNNVHAYEDPTNNNNGAINYSPDGGAALLFDFPVDLTKQPVTYRDAAITNLFYLSNMMHDVWQRYGFDEASGNFQVTNYTGAPGANDDVRAEAQDSRNIATTRNNANFATPIDGFRPRMQMYLWSGIPDREMFRITAPARAAATYPAVEAAFSKPLTATPLEGKAVLVATASGTSEQGCTALSNAGAIAGNFAVVYRGSCDFATKVLNAQQAGATAVIVINNAPGAPIVMGGSPVAPVTVPAVMISQEDGAALRALLDLGAETRIALKNAGSGPEIDGDFDNGIIAHEYGHGISTRLTGGRLTSSCLNNAEQAGEGWSDWFGLMLTMKPGDKGSKVRGIGTYAQGQPTTGRGIRPAPYSTDFAINNYTYAATNNPALSQPHGVGFVWATMIWDMTWALVDKYGYDPNLHTGTGGNNMAMYLVIDGLKLQPCSPGFVDARDAILKADQLRYGGKNQKLIWQVFARRGLGFSAKQGLSTSRLDQVEAFDLPPMYACVAPTLDVIPAYSAERTGLPATTIVLGYGPQSVTLLARSTAYEQYRWAPATGLSTPNEAQTVFTPTQAGTYTFTVTATDKNQCVETAEVTITVLDMRCGNKNNKVQVCHNGRTLCVDALGATDHLAHGDKLGTCGTELAQAPAAAPTSAAMLSAAPNPADSRTTLWFEVPQNGPFRLEVIDMQGRVVRVLAEGEARVGQQYRHEFVREKLRGGLYIVRLVAGTQSKVIRMELRD
ncbi:T9SS-dependent M36 family metallopeptidase [Hymenobacter latericus]|uniref:T9SS-dependent M36 family metallopeptidase n=1 Tax=Hymenobacter sp. YIM 151858-1 TaxID=2987688 RepID=UPI002226B644|nr:T9SS-dependent M36 family metallopeptidase [Hymenobacter sp. YIM 151858-1]UYZ59090.1 T9SS-dependent M36 family metallopeptidase [Hymenobacter sp. YIM 151858-1]